MKRKYYGNDDVISVYKFMENYGLHCEVKGNVAVSHEIMMKKLSLRNEKFPEKVIVPHQVPFSKIEKDDVKTGRTILVKDDLKKIQAYRMPRLEFVPLTKEEKEEIRTKLIEEQRIENEKTDKPMKKGYMKYLYRKALKEAKEELVKIKEEIKKDDYEDYTVTENINRLVKVDKKRKY